MALGTWACINDNCRMEMEVTACGAIEVTFEEGFELLFSAHALERFVGLARGVLES
ncbi:hypothetical protein [Actinokineospora sp. UTMC 2448]|uniref:hypothetical protein n=1 Tax=Actinokineospora sp. UTMC 2448 TaxID=2268449 RepID=UPI002164197D|nr:hypothetical protein [Actinokineospora sp. UTMC 2448]